jgi:hypothetical protein
MAPLLATIGGGSALVGAGTAAGVGLGVAGAIQSGAAASSAAESQQNMADFNAQVQKKEAAAIRTASKFASVRQAKEAARIKSSQKVAIAKAGGIGSPVALDLAAEQAAELELENLLIGFEGETLATKAENQAAIDRASGKIAKQRGKNLKTASTIRAGTSLLTGFGNG